MPESCGAMGCQQSSISIMMVFLVARRCCAQSALRSASRWNCHEPLAGAGGLRSVVAATALPAGTARKSG